MYEENKSKSNIGAIIIHSPEYTERHKNVASLKKFFEEANIKVDIIDGVFTEKPFYDIRYPGKFLTKGQIGVSLAHLNALKLAIDRDYDFCFFFEDDAQCVIPDYTTLNNWINSINVQYDFLLLTNIGMWTSEGHDGRDHYAKHVTQDLLECSCPFSTAAYYVSKDIIKRLFKTQIDAYLDDKLFIADGLHIHCEKTPNNFLKIITPANTNLVFTVDPNVLSIVNKFS